MHKSVARSQWTSGDKGVRERQVDENAAASDKLKISEVGDKQEYRIYRNSIGDREIFSDKI